MEIFELFSTCGLMVWCILKSLNKLTKEEFHTIVYRNNSYLISEEKMEYKWNNISMS